MNTLKFSRIIVKNQKFIFVHHNKQLYVLKNKKKDLYKCISKTCNSKVSIIDGNCIFKGVMHNHNNTAQMKYFEFKSWQLIDNYIGNSSEKIVDKSVKPRDIFNTVKNTYKNFNLNYEKHHQTLRNKMKKIKSEKFQNNKKHRKICLNSLGKKLLSIDKSYEHFLKKPALQEMDDADKDGKSTCKICFANEANIRLDPCGHLLCEKCIAMIYDMEKTKLKERYVSDRIINKKIKLNCHKCRSIVLNKHKIFY